MVVNKGETIHYFKIEIHESGKVEKEHKSYPVVACKENPSYGDLIVIDDFGYSILQTKVERYTTHCIFNKSICYEMNFSYSCDYIVGYLYTVNPSLKMATKRIKKELESYINKKYGRYSNYKIKLDEIQEDD